MKKQKKAKKAASSETLDSECASSVTINWLEKYFFISPEKLLMLRFGFVIVDNLHSSLLSDTFLRLDRDDDLLLSPLEECRLW